MTSEEEYETIKKGANLNGSLRDHLLMLVGHMPVYDMYRELERIPRWKSWMGDVERFISPDHDSRNPERPVAPMMTDIGFTNVKVRCLDKQCIYYGQEAFKKAMLAVLPYKIPFEMLKNFREDFVEVIINMWVVEDAGRGRFNVRLNYNTIVACGRKQTI